MTNFIFNSCFLLSKYSIIPFVFLLATWCAMPFQSYHMLSSIGYNTGLDFFLREYVSGPKKKISGDTFHIPLTNTPFKPDEFQRVHPLFADELPVNTNELLSKTYPPRPLLVNREFICVQRWFTGKKSGLKGFPVNTDENADAAAYISCWAVGLLTTLFAVEWFSLVFIGVWSEKGKEKFIGVLRAEFSPLIHREFNGCQRVKSVWKGYKSATLKGFYIAVYGNFQGLFFIFEGSFLQFWCEIAWSP